MSARVLVVDDSAVVRRLVSSFLEEEADITVVGKARNGRHALQRVEELAPDVVVMDVEMPVMDGIEAVRRLRQVHLKLPVVMFSTFTERGSRAAMDALVAGATAYVTKKATGGEGLKGVVRDALAPKIREVLGQSAATSSMEAPRTPTPSRRESSTPAPRRSDVPPRTSTPTAPRVRRAELEPVPRPALKIRHTSGDVFDVLAIGCSTGGPNALAEIVPRLPGDLGVPVLIVQHMPPRFTRLLAERLDGLSQLTVREAEAGDVITPNTVYLAPGGYHMRVRRKGTRVSITLDREPPVNSCRPAVDPLFWSIAEVWGGNTLAAILTGMGHDGLDGCEVLKEAGATVIAQDEESSVVWGMPRAVSQAGLADEVLPIDVVATTLARRIRQGPSRHSKARSA